MGWWDGIATFYEATIHKNYEIEWAIECLEKQIFFTRCDHLKFFHKICVREQKYVQQK